MLLQLPKALLMMRLLQWTPIVVPVYPGTCTRSRSFVPLSLSHSLNLSPLILNLSIAAALLIRSGFLSLALSHRVNSPSLILELGVAFPLLLRFGFKTLLVHVLS